MKKQKDFKYKLLDIFMKKRDAKNLVIIVYMILLVFFIFIFFYSSSINIPRLGNNNLAMIIITILLWVIFISYIILNAKKRKHVW